MFPILLSLSILSTNPVWESKEILFQWNNKGVGYEYVVEVYTDPYLHTSYHVTAPTTNTYINIVFTETNKYYWSVKYYPIGSTIYDYEFMGQFYLNLEHGYYGEDIIYFPPEEEKIPPVIEEPTQDIEEEIPVDIPVEEKYELPSDIDCREDIPFTSVLGVNTEFQPCNISLLKNGVTSVTSWDCNLNINISKTSYLDWEKYLTLDIDGTYTNSLDSLIKIYQCKMFSLFDPKTWFRCEKILVDTYSGVMKFTYSGYIQVNGISQSNINFGFSDTSFFLRNIFKEDISQKDVKVILNIYSSVKGKEWIDVEYVVKKDIQIPTLVKAVVKKPFSFPIDRDIGVTQWHGCTAYQCPHKGIDFGARLNRVISVGDGTVVKVGYDKYGGECNQGGNFVIVKHTNGMYSTYFHLERYDVSVGKVLKEGDLIGISGNSGKWNCQNLGYHLHFETRKELSSATHVNPVEYIGIDWNGIPTIGYTQYPKRLTGENPHPNF